MHLLSIALVTSLLPICLSANFGHDAIYNDFSKHIKPAVIKHVETPKTDKVKIENLDLVFIGDSRTVGMDTACSLSDNHKVIAEVGKGYSWFIEDGIEDLSSYLKNRDKEHVRLIFNLGVNDLYNCSRYVDLIDTLSDSYEIYYVSVNPVTDKCETVINEDIESFNEAIESIEDVYYIDSYSYLMENGFGTRDGLHYNSETYESLYEFICDEIESKENEEE